MFRKTKLGQLVSMDPRRAKKMIKDAMDRAKGDPELAAKRLDVARRTLDRWVSSLELSDDVSKIKERHREVRA